jgi:hypothetical protein
VQKAIDDDATENMHVKDEVDAMLQRELLSYLLFSRTAEQSLLAVHPELASLQIGRSAKKVVQESSDSS